jgi:hypothetical protein
MAATVFQTHGGTRLVSMPSAPACASWGVFGLRRRWAADPDNRSDFLLSAAISPAMPWSRKIAENLERRTANSLIVPSRYTAAMCQLLPSRRIR